MTQALTGETATIDFRDRDYFPLMYPLLFPHGAVCGWYPDMKSTTGHKISLTQWLTQLLVTEPRFQILGPLVNEFVIDVFSCIEDQRLSFHAHNQDKYRTSVHHASAVARVPRPRRDKAPGAEKIIVPSSFTQGFADQAKKMTEAMALLRHFGTAHYFLTFTCNTVSTGFVIRYESYILFLCRCVYPGSLSVRSINCVLPTLHIAVHTAEPCVLCYV